MSETYIRTTIVSRARQARALNWLERPLWAEPGVAYTVPYEPLSRLKPATRDTVLAEVAKGRLELTARWPRASPSTRRTPSCP